jgi:hypothetical protein
MNRRFFSWLLVLFVVFGAAACGGKNDGDAKSADKGPSLDDALALLPGNAIAVGTVDARAFFGSKTFGAELAKVVEKYVPIGKEANFDAARDVDRVTWGSYSYQGIDAVAVVIGRFDDAKIKEVAASQTPTRMGVPIVISQYAGRDVYTVSNIGFVVLSKERVIVGTESGLRRVLERIKDNRVKRDVLPWMISTLETPGASAAVAGDFASNPAPQEVLRQIPTPLAQNVKAVRVLMSFKETGVEIAASGTYPDDAAAQQAKQHAEQAASFAKWLALFGVTLKNVNIAVEKTDVQVKLEVDDQSLKTLLASLPQYLGG